MTAFHVSTYRLDLLSLGCLARDERSRIESHLADCERCRTLAAETAEARATFSRELVARPPAAVRLRPRWVYWFALGPAVVALVVLMLLRDRAPEFALKGAPSFSTYVRHDGRVSVLRDGDLLRSGDELRFAVVGEHYRYLIVGSVDGAGKVNIYFPYGGILSGQIDPERRVELPGSIVLDEAPGPERVFAAFSTEPIKADELERPLAELARKGAAAIRQTETLPIPTAALSTIVFEKSP